MVDRKEAVDAKREDTIARFVAAGLAKALMKNAAADTVAGFVDEDSSAGIVVDVDVDRTGAEDALCTKDDLPST